MSKKQNDDKIVKIGSIVKVDIAPYKFYRGTVVNIENNIATIEVPTFWGNGEPVVVSRDYNSLKLAEPNKKQRG